MLNKRRKAHQPIIAIDFDGVITKANRIRKDATEYINKLYDRGMYIIIWTAKRQERIDGLPRILQQSGIKYHLINDNAPWITYNPRKIAADMYVDDKGVFYVDDWKEIYLYILQRFKYKE